MLDWDVRARLRPEKVMQWVDMREERRKDWDKHHRIRWARVKREPWEGFSWWHQMQ